MKIASGLLMDNKLFIVDFDDSFTLNIASLFYENGSTSEIIHWKSIGQLKNKLTKTNVIIWGPGPGSPRDYSEIFDVIKNCVENVDVYNFGVCLGHQILGLIRGYELIEADKKRHGQSESIELNEYFKNYLKLSKIEVQFYNSLGLNTSTVGDDKTQLLDGNILIIANERFLSYQFHPESIGTSCPSSLIAPVLAFLYNGCDEYWYQSRRDLR